MTSVWEVGKGKDMDGKISRGLFQSFHKQQLSRGIEYLLEAR